MNQAHRFCEGIPPGNRGAPFWSTTAAYQSAISNFGKDSAGAGSVTIATSVTAIHIRLSHHLGRIEVRVQTELIDVVLNFPDVEHVKLGSRVIAAGKVTPCD